MLTRGKFRCLSLGGRSVRFQTRGSGTSAYLGIQSWGVRMYLDPKSGQNNGPKSLNIGSKAIILHTFGVQVGVLGLSVRSIQA